MQLWQRVELGYCRWLWPIGLCACLFLLVSKGHAVQVQSIVSPTLPVPQTLRPQIDFWKQIFTKVGGQSGLLHDTDDLTIVYHTLRNLPRNPRQQQRRVDRYRRRYKHILETLAKGKRKNLSRDEARVLALFKGKQTSKAFRLAARNIRFQLGLRDRFARGLARSGAYIPEIRRVFADAGLPAELAFLPHVESSFNNGAYSKYGAAGMWQFTRGTGRLFLRINRAIDERLDPQQATKAAAKLLKMNYQELGTWPLAVTAYNHGVGGMKRAVATLKTRDFGTIVRRYRSRSFGFASRNFYAELLAVVEVVKHYETYFGAVTFDKPQTYHTLKLDAYMDIHTLGKYLDVSPRDIARWNPALRPPILRAQRLLPRGFELKISRHHLSAADMQARWNDIPLEVKFAQQLQGGKYRIRRGDTLSTIAHRFGTSVDRLVDANELRRPNQIRIGQTLHIPKHSRRMVASKRQEPRKVISKPVTRLVQTARSIPSSTQPDSLVAFAPNSTLPLEPSRMAFHLLIAGFPLDEQRAPQAKAWLQIKRKRTRVVASETLGLYAEWLEIPVRRLRHLNRLRRRRPLPLGTEIRLDFTKVSEDTFTRRRRQHHQRIEENFFRTYAVDDVITHTVKRGETLWKLAHREYEIPLWLVQKYNAHIEFRSLPPGTKLRIPQVVAKAS